MPDYIEVRSTTDSREEANKICNAVVEARLAACAQVSGPIRSTYWWQGKIERADEYFLTDEDHPGQFRDLAQVIRENHFYDVPDIVAVPIVPAPMTISNGLAPRRESAPHLLDFGA